MVKTLHLTYSKKSKKNIRKVIGLALIFVILSTFVASFLYLTLPFWPEIKYRISKSEITELDVEVSDETAEKLGIKKTKNYKEAQILDSNLLIIPKIGVKAKILEHSDLSILDVEEGVWREPFTNTPEDEGGNTVIAGHRFQYLPPNTSTFYHLDKLKSGDKILVIWDKKEYIYEVQDIFEVEPSDTYIRDNSGESLLTLYTCTPLGSEARRLVVRAKLLNN
ncbi:MAG: hypothetical protein KatS3mg085_297 [Candidatus Dojkabacteria bacterium]|nr:MAG: hypothetical protein KatS3mg085_297 [Candidatus Dojkabacteria bacterium]GIW58887.1 MAG: hypothetical protein KatS3mg086_172 [Candidatus Dojkabacteria bacterium]